MNHTLKSGTNQFSSCSLHCLTYKLGSYPKIVQLWALKAASTWSGQVVMTHLFGLLIFASMSQVPEKLQTLPIHGMLHQ